MTSPDSAEDSRLTSTCWPAAGLVAVRAARRARRWSRAARPSRRRPRCRPGTAGPSGVAGQAHQPGDRLHDQVVAGQRRALPAAAEAADRGVDDAAGCAAATVVVVEPEAGQPAGPEVLDQRRRRGAASSRRERDVVGVLEVERDRALVAVDAEVVGRDAVAHRRHPGAGVVAGRALDLDHLGAEVGEQHRGVGPGEDPGEVGDQQPAAGRRTLRRRPVGPSSVASARIGPAPTPPRSLVRHPDGCPRPSSAATYGCQPAVWATGPPGSGRSRRSPRRPPAAAAADARPVSVSTEVSAACTVTFIAATTRPGAVPQRRRDRPDPGRQLPRRSAPSPCARTSRSSSVELRAVRRVPGGARRTGYGSARTASSSSAGSAGEQHLAQRGLDGAGNLVPMLDPQRDDLRHGDPRDVDDVGPVELGDRASTRRCAPTSRSMVRPGHVPQPERLHVGHAELEHPRGQG